MGANVGTEVDATVVGDTVSLIVDDPVVGPMVVTGIVEDMPMHPKRNTGIDSNKKAISRFFIKRTLHSVNAYLLYPNITKKESI